MSYPYDVIKKLVEGKLPLPEIQKIQNEPKDPDRFEKYLRVLQEKVKWDDEIVMRVHEHLYIVRKEGNYIVKCDCGYEFGDYRENWKLKALIYVRNREELEELYPEPLTPEWIELREFYCPGCATLLWVEALIPGYPINFEFLPDLKSFYQQWLNKELERAPEFEDLSVDVIKKWAKE